VTALGVFGVATGLLAFLLHLGVTASVVVAIPGTLPALPPAV
jgi:hypothetical protein